MKRTILLLLITLMVASMALPQTVLAAVSNLAVTGDGTFTNGVYGGVPANWNGMNLSDGTTSYLEHSIGVGTTHYRSWTHQAYAATGEITEVRTVQRFINTTAPANSCSVTPFIYIGGTRYYSTPFTPTSTWTTTYTSWYTNPATGLPWTTAAINSAEYGYRVAATAGSPDLLITFQRVDVYYNPPVLPSVDTDAADEIVYQGGSHNATLNGDVTDDGNSDIDCRGFAWSTTSNTTNPGNVTPTDAVINLGYTANWTECDSDYGEGVFDYTLTGLVACTTYYYRAYAHNVVGWTYGDEVSFSTLCSPLIQSQAATYVEATTARLNALVISDGNQACDVRFAYGTTSANCTYNGTCAGATCNATEYDTVTAWVENTYTTGQTPYVDITGLAVSTTYYFCVQIRNDVNCTCGGELSFTTETGINEPADFKGIPSAEEISLFWVKGTGSTNTLIRYKTGSYPSDVLDGTEVYFDSETSVLHTGLTRGTTYFYKAWGESGGTYSTDNVTLIITTLSTPDEADDQPTPGTPDSWFQTPDYTKMSGLPFYGLVNWWADSFEIPRGTLWFMGIIGFATGAAILAYWKSQKVLIAAAVLLVFFGTAAAIELAPLWVIAPPVLIIFAALIMGERV